MVRLAAGFAVLWVAAVGAVALASPSFAVDSSPTPTATDSPSPTATDSPSPTATDSPSPTATDSPSPTATDSPSPTATVSPDAAPTDQPYAPTGFVVDPTSGEVVVSQDSFVAAEVLAFLVAVTLGAATAWLMLP